MSLDTVIVNLQNFLETTWGITPSGGFLGHTVTPQTGSQFIVRPICAFTDGSTRRPGADLKVALMVVAPSPSDLIGELSSKLDQVQKGFNGPDATMCLCDVSGKCVQYSLQSDFQIGDIEGFQESRAISAVSFCKVMVAFKVNALG